MRDDGELSVLCFCVFVFLMERDQEATSSIKHTHTLIFTLPAFSLCHVNKCKCGEYARIRPLCFPEICTRSWWVVVVVCCAMECVMSVADARHLHISSDYMTQRTFAPLFLFFVRVCFTTAIFKPCRYLFICSLGVKIKSVTIDRNTATFEGCIYPQQVRRQWLIF